MDEIAGRIMAILIAINWVIMAWCLRLTEARGYLLADEADKDNFTFDFAEMLWLVPITFTTIGYGDLYPRTYWGRGFVLWVGFSGIIAAAIAVTVMTDKLHMTRRERLLQRVLNIDAIDTELKHRAATVLQRAYRRRLANKVVIRWPNPDDYKIDEGQLQAVKSTAQNLADQTVLTSEEAALMGLRQGGDNRRSDRLFKTGNDDSHSTEDVNEALPGKKRGMIPVIFDGHFLDAIKKFKKLRIERKFMVNEQHDLVDLGMNQIESNDGIQKLKKEMKTMEQKMDLILNKLGCDMPEDLKSRESKSKTE